MYALIRLAAADITKWCAWGPVRIHYITGYNAQSSDRFIQFFQKPAADIAASDIPDISGFFAPAAAPFDWPFPSTYEINLSELSIGISSTQPNYTAAGAGTGIDGVALIESEFLVTANTTRTGDLTSAVASKQVWTEANGASSPNRLLRLDIINNSGDIVFAVMQASDAASTTDHVLPSLKLANVSTTQKFMFGKGGQQMSRNDAGTNRQGCTVRFVPPTTIGGVKTLVTPMTFDAVANYNVRAIYENE